MADEPAFEWPKGREHLLEGVCSAVRRVKGELNSGTSINTNRIKESFAEQFSKFTEGSDIEWQFRPSIERDERGRLKDAGFLFDLIWYNVVRVGKLCLLQNVALIVESELSSGLKQAQHDFLKLLCFNSLVKLAIVHCSELNCRNLVSNAIRECRDITEGRYMIWRVNGHRIELFAEFDLCLENGDKRLNPIDGLLFKSKDVLDGWEKVSNDYFYYSLK